MKLKGKEIVRKIFDYMEKGTFRLMILFILFLVILLSSLIIVFIMSYFYGIG